MSFGGGSPGLSILIGVARGVAEDDKRRREIEQDAINARLKEQQITQMEEASTLNKEREQRYRDTEIARQEESAQVRAQAEATRAQEEEHRQVLTGLIAKQYMTEEGMDELTANERATLDMSGIQHGTDPEKEVSIRDQAFLEDRMTAEEMELDMNRVFANRELSRKIMSARNIVEVEQMTEEWNAQNETDYSPEAARAVWQDVNRTALDPGTDWGNFAELSANGQRRVSEDAAVLSGRALNDAEKAIAKWTASNQPKEGEEPRVWDPYEIAQTIIVNKNQAYINKGGSLPFDQAVADRMLFELERLRQAEHDDEDEENDPLSRIMIQNRPGG